MYAPWLGFGAGVTNYLSVPDFPMNPEGTEFTMPGGTIMNADLGTFRPITSFSDEYFRDNVAESIAHSWYDGDWQKHPWEEDTVPAYSEYDYDGRYSWVKAPRFDGKPMQVGPLAQVLAALASGDELTTKFATETLQTAGKIAGANLTPAVLHSTLGRHAARMIRCRVIAHQALGYWEALVNNIASGDTEIFTPFEFPAGEIQGFGFHEAPRGTLSCPRPGTPDRVMEKARWGRTKPRWSATRSPIRSARSRYCGRFTPSILVWPARSTPTIRMGTRSRRSESFEGGFLRHRAGEQSPAFFSTNNV
jgi:hydrogenase large subunit